MIKKELDKIKRNVENKFDQTSRPGIPIKILQYFPEDNAVSIEMGSGRLSVRGVGQGQKFPLGVRADESEGLCPQVGDRGMLFYSGSQISSGFVMLSHTKGSHMSNRYSPIRGGWAI